MGARIGFKDGPPANPIDASSTVAIIGFCSGQLPSGNPQQPNVIPIDSPSQVTPASVGYGSAPELAHLMARRGKKRCLIVPSTPSVAGVLSAVTQVGQGPVCTV